MPQDLPTGLLSFPRHTALPLPSPMSAALPADSSSQHRVTTCSGNCFLTKSAPSAPVIHPVPPPPFLHHTQYTIRKRICPLISSWQLYSQHKHRAWHLVGTLYLLHGWTRFTKANLKLTLQNTSKLSASFYFLLNNFWTSSGPRLVWGLMEYLYARMSEMPSRSSRHNLGKHVWDKERLPCSAFPGTKSCFPSTSQGLLRKLLMALPSGLGARPPYKETRFRKLSWKPSGWPLLFPFIKSISSNMAENQALPTVAWFRSGDGGGGVPHPVRKWPFCLLWGGPSRAPGGSPGLLSAAHPRGQCSDMAIVLKLYFHTHTHTHTQNTELLTRWDFSKQKMECAIISFFFS